MVSEDALQIQSTDRYGRIVAELFRGGDNMNLAMVRQGAAFAFRMYMGQCHAITYWQAESHAEFQRAGVWASSMGSPRPWDWRAVKRENQTAPSPRPAKGAGSDNPGVMTGGTMPRLKSGGAGERGRSYCKNPSHKEAQRLLSQGHNYLDRDGEV